MNKLASQELELVSGGDAAATRQLGQNSWGESPPAGDGLCGPWDIGGAILSILTGSCS